MEEKFQPDIVASTLKRSDLKSRITISDSFHKVEQGDIIAVEVKDKGGKYNQIEDLKGNHHKLKKGVKILGVVGERKAVQGFVAEIPGNLEKGDKLQFIGGGGVFGNCLDYFEEVGEPWDVEFKGFAVENGKKLNFKDFAIPLKTEIENCSPLIMVAGTRMDSGKTTLASNIIKELSDQGFDIGAAKLTGFTRQRDRMKMKNHGAVESLDFVDAGILHTMGNPERAIKAGKTVLSNFKEDMDAVVVELGGGLIGPDHVIELLTDKEIAINTEYLIITAMDPVSAFGSVKMLEKYGMEPDLISGPATDTETGKEGIREHAKVEALNGRKNFEQISSLIEEKLES
ncbi:MAG: hypothetical protein SVV03_06100 [Candidatus Nanohaloarchaea archaeon]|nr:hypothetical protein [Candidatus Nanohaloarchaea archaeon]